MDQTAKDQLELISRTVDNFNSGYLEMDMGYKFRTREFLNVIFLYINSVDVRNPDILGATNKNTFIYEPQAAIEKIKEQIRLDLKDINFSIHGASTLGRFIPKAANRKILEDNNFAEILDEIPDNAVDFGSGFLKVWEMGGKLKMKSIDPYALIFNQYNFKDGLKIERFKKTGNEILADEKYDKNAQRLLSQKLGKDQEKLDESILLYQSVKDLPDGTQEIVVADLENELVYYTHETKKGKKSIVSYYKFDYKKRKGFPDALGIGCNEKIFNKLVQSKVNRERMDKVMEVASKLPFQKQIDNERDNMVGKDVIKLETSAIIGHKGNPITLLDTGGTKQAALIRSELNEIMQTIGNDLNVTEALMGNTLPSGTSGVLGNLLTENSSSVLKDVKKSYAKYLDRVYRDRIIPYILKGLKSSDNLRKYLSPNDIKVVERAAQSYFVAQKYIDSVINNEPWNRAVAEEQVKQERKGKPIISGELLDQLREEMDGIKTYISGEDISKAQAVAFIRELSARYVANPAQFQDPFVLELIKQEAEFDAGMSGLEIDQMLEMIPEQAAQNVPVQ